MTHARLTDKEREHAALHALGALDPAEARAFEAHLAEGCRVCRAEVEGYAEVTGTLALAAPPVAPAPDLRARVLTAATRKPLPLLHFTHAGDEAWTEIQPGVLRRDLAADPGSPAYLIRIAPGASVEMHQHAVIEHCYVLSGDLKIIGHDLRAGDYHRAAPGTVHDRIRSDTGCTLLVVEAAA